jgi:hypothetical protein
VLIAGINWGGLVDKFSCLVYVVRITAHSSSAGSQATAKTPDTLLAGAALGLAPCRGCFRGLRVVWASLDAVRGDV